MTQLIDHNPDIKKLHDEGYQLDVINDNLVVFGIPYVTEDKEIDFGILYCPLNLSGETLNPPRDHTARFVGKYPCNQFGQKNSSFVNKPDPNRLSEKIQGEYFFSSKPSTGNYSDYYTKISRYVHLLSDPAKSIDPSVSSRNFDYKAYKEETVFNFNDSYSSRNGIYELNSKLKGHRVAIVGLGGTGAYLLDHIAKTYVDQITLIDGDVMQNHNLFRLPGAHIPQDLNGNISKVEFWMQKYLRFRKNIIAIDAYLAEDNINLLDGNDFVFITIDNTTAKKIIIDWLLCKGIPFIDLGMGLSKVNNSIRGQIRKTFVTPGYQKYVNRINMSPVKDEDIYKQNIQTSELNNLNALLGIIEWKRWCGIYLSVPEETPYNSTYIIDEGTLLNET